MLKIIANAKRWENKTGYKTWGTPKNSDPEAWRPYFAGLNEAVVEKMTMEILQKNADKLEDPKMTLKTIWEIGQWGDYPLVDEKDHPDLEDYLKGKIGSYEFEREILEIIIRKIVGLNSETEEEVWRRFKIGHITGSLMHLRDIEKAFSKGALRVYANLIPEIIYEGEEKEDEGEVIKKTIYDQEIFYDGRRYRTKRHWGKDFGKIRIRT